MVAFQSEARGYRNIIFIFNAAAANSSRAAVSFNLCGW